jgi:hypothetical protein
VVSDGGEGRKGRNVKGKRERQKSSTQACGHGSVSGSSVQRKEGRREGRKEGRGEEWRVREG